LRAQRRRTWIPIAPSSPFFVFGVSLEMPAVGAFGTQDKLSCLPSFEYGYTELIPLYKEVKVRETKKKKKKVRVFGVSLVFWSVH